MNEIIITIVGVLGGVLTRFVSEELKQGPVRASALLTLLFGLLVYALTSGSGSYFAENAPLVFFGGTFVGMASVKVITNYFGIIISSLVFGCLYLLASSYFAGFGGSLGLMACVSDLVAIGFLKTISRK